MLLCVQNLELAINDDHAFFHFDYEYADGTGPPNFWYYGVLRDFHRFPTNMPPNYTAELWRLRTGLNFCGPFPPSAERVGTVNIRGMLGRRCWLSPFGRHFYALYLHRGDAIAVGDEDFFSGTEIPRNRNYQVGLMQITMGNNKGSSSETTMSLTRKDFALSAQPTPVNWQGIPSGIGFPKVECEHIHFVSATQFVLVTGTIEWVDQQSRRGPSFEGVDAKASRTQFHWISIDEANSIAHVSRIELPEPPLASRENFYIDDRRIYLHVGERDQDNRSAFVFYTLDWTRQLRVLNAETQQWEEFELDTRNSDFGIAEIVDDEGGTSADEFYSVRFDNGLLLRKHIDSVYSKQGGVVFIQLLPAQRSYMMRVMFKLSHLNVDARGSLMSVRIYPNVHDRVRVHLHIYVSPPYVAPLRYLAYWRLREMLQVNDRKEFDEEKETMRSAAGYYKRMPAKHDPSSSGSLAIDELSVHNEKWAKLLQQADTSTMLYPIPLRNEIMDLIKYAVQMHKKQKQQTIQMQNVRPNICEARLLRNHELLKYQHIKGISDKVPIFLDPKVELAGTSTEMFNFVILVLKFWSRCFSKLPYKSPGPTLPQRRGPARRGFCDGEEWAPLFLIVFQYHNARFSLTFRHLKHLLLD